MAKRYGGKDGYKEHFKKMGAKGGVAPTTKLKGFAANPELAKKAGAIGGLLSRRQGNYDKEWAKYSGFIMAMRDSGESVADIARKFDLPYSMLKHRIKKMEEKNDK